MAERNSETQLAVIGGGPGGYAAAFLAADLGLEVTLVDPEVNPGGVCLYRGCIPSKALLHAVKVMRQARRAADWGVTFGEPQVDLERLRAWKNEVVGRLTGGLGTLVKQRKIRYIRGQARFRDSGTLEIESGQEGAPGTLAFRNAILCTGARPTAFPGLSFDSPKVWSSKTALELPEIPKTLLVVGGGYIGLEMSTVYSELGSKVTIVEMMPQLMPGADSDVVSTWTKAAGRLFESVRAGTRAELEETAKGVRARFIPSSEEQGSEGPKEQTFDRVLITVGRQPNSEDLGLENTRVQTDGKGFVRVDAQRRTDDPAIFAVGDVAGGVLLAHKAMHEGRTAVEVIAGRNVSFEPRAIPAVEYTDPEIAWCGLTENEAREQGREIKVARFPWAASGRAMTMGRPEGLTKLIIDPETERILGVAIVGAEAGELISEGVLAIEMAAVAEDLALTIHPHPTLSETLKEAAEVYYGTPTDIYRPRR